MQRWRIGRKFHPNDVKYVTVKKKKNKCPPGFNRVHIEKGQYGCVKGDYFATKVR